MNSGSTSQRLRPFKPTRFGRYTLLMPLSVGGMGEVFLARIAGAHGFDKLVVIKKILPELAKEQDFVRRFVDEGRILVKLSHGAIAQVLDMGVHEGAPYIALEFIDGKDLRRVLGRMRERNLPLPLSFVLYVMTRVLDALAYAHRKRGDHDEELNLVHRDMSPQNVLISYEGEVKVIDFGLAKSALSESNTNPSIVLGKFMYMAPEQARHQPTDRRTDLYAVGLCLWELVVGKNPFEDVPRGELMARVGSPRIPPLNQVEPLCPQALSDAVGKALAVDPSQRFQSAEEFRGKLQTILQDIDPQAGAETATRFMREAFGAEYTTERRMLASVKEQARELDQAGAAEPEPAQEETLQPTAAPGGPRPTPLAIAAIHVEADTLPVRPSRQHQAPAMTPLPALSPPRPAPVRAAPTGLSFQPTPKVVSLSGDAGPDVHEKETLPAIQLKPPAPPPPAPAPAGNGPSPVRASPKLLEKSRDQEPTEAATPAIAEPENLPSIVIDGLPSEPVKTEREIPVQRASKAHKAPLEDEPTAPRGKKKGATEKPKAKAQTPKASKPAKPSPPPPRPPQHGETMHILRPVTSGAPGAAPPAPARSSGAWLWFVIPALVGLTIAAIIAWDVTHPTPAATDEAEEAVVHDEPVTPEPAPAPAPVKTLEAAPPGAAPAPEAEAPKPEAPKKRAPVPKAEVGGTPGQQALRALKADYERIEDDGVQRQFTLKLNQLSSQVEARGEDPAYVQQVEALHEKVKGALPR